MFKNNVRRNKGTDNPVNILHKSIAGRYQPVRVGMSVAAIFIQKAHVVLLSSIHWTRQTCESVSVCTFEFQRVVSADLIYPDTIDHGPDLIKYNDKLVEKIIL